jgi:hypothetical protein
MLEIFQVLLQHAVFTPASRLGTIDFVMWFRFKNYPAHSSECLVWNNINQTLGSIFVATTHTKRDGGATTLMNFVRQESKYNQWFYPGNDDDRKPAIDESREDQSSVSSS